MQFTLSASGNPAQVRDTVNQQAKAAARGNSGAWPAVSAIRDHVNAELRDVPEDGSVSVSVSVTIAISGTPKRVAAGAITTATTGTVPVDGKAVGVVGEARIIEGVAVETSEPRAEGVQVGGVTYPAGSQPMPEPDVADPAVDRRVRR